MVLTQPMHLFLTEQTLLPMELVKNVPAGVKVVALPEELLKQGVTH
jgi:hypothetical protein